MAAKYDGVVDAVRYRTDGQIQWIRVYERRGATFTDRILLNRQQMIDRLKAGKKFIIGERQPQLASTFVVSQPVRLVKTSNGDVLASGDGTSSHDDLKGAPVF
ncbi:MAG: hypothetical protein PHQ40_06090 [Anaerolineaceae bacterium]|nr:hypothetical protein [Anaerolineaceae bacterium]